MVVSLLHCACTTLQSVIGWLLVVVLNIVSVGKLLRTEHSLLQALPDILCLSSSARLCVDIVSTATAPLGTLAACSANYKAYAMERFPFATAVGQG